MAQSNLSQAKKGKNDEFYTQYVDIQKEIEAYLEYDSNTFTGKVIYCNCDDPFESNFFRYFVLNFNKLWLKQLISTSYKPSPIANTQLGLFGDDETLVQVKWRPKLTANKFIINEVKDIDGDGEFNLKDIALQLKANKNNEWSPIEWDGDFRSQESIDLLKQADIVVTNPPFSLFREYVEQLVEYKKTFLIIGNMNAITYKEIFPLIKDNKVWLGVSMDGRNKWFQVPDTYPINENVANSKITDGKKFLFVKGCVWFTNLDHGRRHQPLPLMTEADVIKFSTKKTFIKYDNYDAIEVSKVKDIPSDYKGVMWVPISFLHKHNPEQFEILWTNDNGIIDDKFKTTPGLSKKFVEDYYKCGGTWQYKEGNPTAWYYENNIAKMAYKRIFIQSKN